MNCTKILLSFLATVLLLASCGKSDDLATAIPADAVYVLNVNSKSIVDKSDYNIFKNQTVQQGINMLKAGLKDQASVELLDKFLEDSNSLGLTLKGDCYMYTNLSEFGLVLGVNNADKFAESLKTFKIDDDKVKKEGDVYTLELGNDVAVVWNKTKLLVVGAAPSRYRGDTEDVDFVQKATAQLSQKTDNSILSVKAFKEFTANQKDISVFYNLSNIEKLYEMYGGMGMTKMFEGPLGNIFKQVEGTSMGLFTSFETGEIKFTSKYYFDNADTEKRIKELSQQVTGEITGDHLKYLTADPLFAISVNVKGEGMYKYFDDLGLMKEFTKTMDDSTHTAIFEKIFKQVNGDITFSLNTVKEVTMSYDVDIEDGQEDYGYDNTYTETIPECLLLVDMANTEDVISFIKEKIAEEENSEVEELSATTFKVKVKGVNIYFGTVDKTFVITNIESVFKGLGSAGQSNNYSSLIKGKSCVMFGDIQTIMPMVLEKAGNAAQKESLVNFIKLFGKYEFTASSSDMAGEGKLVINDTSKNSLAVIWQHVDKMISDLKTGLF